jgi:hypothetical protein
MVTEIVSPANQQKALYELLKTISPSTLTLSESLLKILPPRPPGYPRTLESFAGHTGLTFDPDAATESATEITLGLLFNPQRASRLAEYHARDAQYPSLQEVIEATISATWKAPTAHAMQAKTQRITRSEVTEHLLALAANNAASVDARTIARAEVLSLRSWIGTVSAASSEDKALNTTTLARIDLFLKDPEKFVPAPPPPVPPGQPIGDDQY